MKWVSLFEYVQPWGFILQKGDEISKNLAEEFPRDGFMLYRGFKMMTKENLVETISKILKTDVELEFLLKLAPRELEILLVCLRGLADQEKK